MAYKYEEHPAGIPDGVAPKNIESVLTIERDKLKKGEVGKMTFTFTEPVHKLHDGFFSTKGKLEYANLKTIDDGQTWTVDLIPTGRDSGAQIFIMANGAYGKITGGGIVGRMKMFPVATENPTPPNNDDTSISIDVIADDNIINHQEKSKGVVIQGKVKGEFSEGDVVTLQLNGKQYETKVNAEGVYQYQLPTDDIPADGSYTVNVSVAASNGADNVNQDGSIQAQQIIKVITQVNGKLTLQDFTDSANAHIAGSDKDNITNDNNFTLKFVDADAGSTVVYQRKVNGVWQDVDAKQENLADGIYEFRAKVSDAYGNSTISPSQTITIDTTADAISNVAQQKKTIVGESTAGSVVEARDAEGNIIGKTVVVGEDGKFSIEIGNYKGTASVVSIDKAGNVSDATDLTIKGEVKHHKVYTAASGVDGENHLLGYNQVHTSEGDDWIEIGNGAQDCWTCGTQGNIWNAWPHLGWTTLDTGAGNDRIDTGVSGGYGNMYAYTSVDMGSGNDILNIKGQMYSNSFVDMGTGDDVIHIGGNIHNHASVQSLSGNNVLVVGEDIDDYAKVLFGNGNDIIEVGEDVEGMAQVITGSGDDSVSVKYDVEGRSIINTGEGNDTLSVGEDIEDCVHIDMGSGNDTLTVARFVENAVVVDMGDGDNTATMAGLNNWAHISFGSGNDQLNVTHQFGVGGGYATADMGAGDDTFTFGGIMPDGVVHGGSGLDTLVLTYDASAVATERCCHITNLASNNFTGFEHIELNGKNALDIRYSDLVNDNTRDGALYIKGNANSKVDLGATDWNSDTDKDLHDVGGGQWNSTGTQEVAGVEYQVYHHSAAGSDLSNDVYIQTGVIVI